MDAIDGAGAPGLSDMIVQAYLARQSPRSPSDRFTTAQSEAGATQPPPSVTEGRETAQSRGQSAAQAGNLFLSQVDPEADGSGLTEAEKETVAQLKARDREVRNHEEAHARVGGQFAGAPSYTFQSGPDGQQYAVGGEVAIDVAPVADDPEATIEKMEVVKAAALAPAEPSAQDRKVASLADAQRTQAIGDLAELRRAVNEGEAEPGVDTAI